MHRLMGNPSLFDRSQVLQIISSQVLGEQLKQKRLLSVHLTFLTQQLQEDCLTEVQLADRRSL